MRLAPLWLAAALLACRSTTPALVHAPVAPGEGAASKSATSSAGSPPACQESWRLEDVTSDAIRVLVVCAADVRRVPVQPATMAPALDPALALAQQRVCSCASQLPAPATLDLVVKAAPASGRARVEPSEADEADDGLDAGAARAFRACVGALETHFPPYTVDACEGEDKTTYVYSLSVELGGAGRH